MEKTIEVKAIDKEKALKRGLNRLGVELTENEIVEVVEKVAPRKKLFGLLGTEDGIYEIIIKKKETPKVKETIKKVHHEENSERKNLKLEKEINEKVSFFLEKMKLDLKYKLKKVKERSYIIDFYGDDNAVIIGQKGKTLNSFEYLLNSMIKNCKIEIDVEKFKEKRNATLRSLAKKMADRVSKTGKTVRLNSMPPRERKVIHEIVNKYPDLDTYSEGRDPKRYIVIKKKK